MNPAQLDGDTQGTNTSTGSTPCSAALRFARSVATASWPIYSIGPTQAQRPRRAGMRAAAIEGRKGHASRVRRSPGLGRERRDAGQAVGRVTLEARLSLLAVADDVDTELRLFLHDRRDRFLGLLRQRRVVGLVLHAGEKQRGKRIGARQAAVWLVRICWLRSPQPRHDLSSPRIWLAWPDPHPRRRHRPRFCRAPPRLLG